MNIINLLKNIIENDFYYSLKSLKLSNEEQLRNTLVKFLRNCSYSDLIDVQENYKTEYGEIDILVNHFDQSAILELKYADNSGTLERGISEIVRYSNYSKKIIMILLDIGILKEDILQRYINYYRQVGGDSIVLPIEGKRKSSTTIQDLLRKNILQKRIFSVKEIKNYFTKHNKSLNVALSRLEKKGKLDRIEKGKYVTIPFGAEKGRYTLNEFVIGASLLNNETYSVGYWNALNHYGLTEQIPNIVFLQTDQRKKKANIKVFGVSYKIIRVNKDKIFGIEKLWIDKMPINITDKEKTIIDCLDKPQYCGGLIEVFKALNNIKDEEYSKDKLIKYALRINNSGVIRRLGYICDYVGITIEIPRPKTRNYLYLDPTMPKRGEPNAKWRLIVNLDEKFIGDLE